MEDVRVEADGRPPRIVAIELTNQCNLRCSHCPQSRVKVEPGFMEEGTLRAALSFCSGYTELNWRGESLMHPRVVEFAALVKHERPDLDLGLHTNGLLMTRAKFSEFVDTGIDWLHFSLHTHKSCLRFIEARTWNEAMGSPLSIYADVDTTQEYITALAAGLKPGEFRSDQVANWAGLLTGYRTVHDDPASAARACLMLRENLCILAWDGRVNACCWDFANRHVIGRIEQFESIRHAPVYPLCASCIWLTPWSVGR